MRILTAIAFVLAAFPAIASDPFQAELPPAMPPHAALYSFADLYRLTVTGEADATLSAAGLEEPAIRVAATPAARAAEAQFTVRSVPQPSPWLLLASGLAAATWVARRRLGYFF